MNLKSSRIPNLDLVSFDRAKRIWVESGVLPVVLSSAGFGGALSLLCEANRISEALEIPEVLVISSSASTWLHALASKFEISRHARWPSYPWDVNEVNSFHAHSTLRLLRCPELNAFPGENSIWSESVIDDAAIFMDSVVVGKTVLFATKFQEGKRRVGDFPHEQWMPILRQLTQSYKVLVLGSNPTREFFEDLKVVFLADTLSLPAQAQLVSSQTIPLIGDASGFFSAAIWHRGAYLCFKDPNYDEAEMMEEHGGENQLHVGSGAQYLIRNQPTLEVVNEFLRKANHGN